MADSFHNSPPPPGDYLRQVRHLRAQLATRPAELQRRLTLLAQSRDQAIAQQAGSTVRRRPSDPAPRSTKPLFSVSNEVAELFATEVEAALEAGLLRFDARRRLIARAYRLGLNRFEANLLIASVLHAAVAPPVAGRTGRRLPLKLIACLTVEAALLTGLVAAFFG